MQLPGKGVQAVYDSGSNISLINSKIAKQLNLTCYTLINPNFDMVSGHGKVLGLTKLEIKIFNIKRTVIVFIMDEKGFKHDFLIGLDLIKAFHLCQDHNLRISQRRWRPWYKGRRQHWTTKKYINTCLLYTSPSPRDRTRSRMPSSA